MDNKQGKGKSWGYYSDVLLEHVGGWELGFTFHMILVIFEISYEVNNFVNFVNEC